MAQAAAGADCHDIAQVTRQQVRGGRRQKRTRRRRRGLLPTGVAEHAGRRDRGCQARHSQRRGAHVGLSVRGLRQRAAHARERLARWRQRDAEPRRAIDQWLRTYFHRQLREVRVAGVYEAAAHVDRPVRMGVQHIVADGMNPSGQRSSHPSIGQPSAREFGPGEIDITPQPRSRGHQLERRSWRVQPVARPIEQRLLRRSAVGAKAGAVRRRPRIAHAGEHGAAVGIEHHGCGFARRLFRMRFDDGRDADLQSGVNRQPHVPRAAAQREGGRMVRLVPVAQERHDLPEVAPDRRHRPAAGADRRHDRGAIVESAQRRFGVAFDIRGVRRAPVHAARRVAQEVKSAAAQRITPIGGRRTHLAERNAKLLIVLTSTL